MSVPGKTPTPPKDAVLVIVAMFRNASTSSDRPSNQVAHARSASGATFKLTPPPSFDWPIIAISASKRGLYRLSSSVGRTPQGRGGAEGSDFGPDQDARRARRPAQFAVGGCLGVRPDTAGPDRSAGPARLTRASPVGRTANSVR